MTTYMGFDVSPLRIGAAAVEKQGSRIKLRWAETFTFSTDEWIRPGDRADVIEAWGDKYENTPEAIGLEAVFIGPNKLGSIRAAMALGQIEMALDNEYPDATQKILTAAQWRKYCGIQQGGKQPVMEWALAFAGKAGSKLWKIEESQDTADAIAIAYATCRWSIEYGYEDND